MSSSFENIPESKRPNIRERIQQLESQLALLRIEKNEERRASLDLAKENRLLMSDPPTRYIIEHEGKTPEGRDVGDVRDFLAEREAELIKNPPYLSGGKRHLSPDTSVLHSKSWEEKESHE